MKTIHYIITIILLTTTLVLIVWNAGFKEPETAVISRLETLARQNEVLKSRLVACEAWGERPNWDDLGKEEGLY